MDTEAAPTRPTRPVAVTIAVVIWWLVFGARLVASVPGLVGELRTAGPLLVGAVGAVVVVLGWTALVAWGAWRMGRGSRTARLLLAVFAGLEGCTVVIQLATGGGSWLLLETAALLGAAVLTYLPSARGWFPKAERRPRRVEPKTIGWDPETGERITEEPGVDLR
ncbi:hypothetical protein [Curtobacterium sp. MCBA15_001]|uniref:hypothetical protein n=1 Tax=Curtobacterium sp. MCBA15_001 TaxID=1898731 RepID=UPI0008DC956A|nr:hypothetical protein [Curtobacterium sp. MCBA15_001]OIH96493.1 hypothetical protein BIU90_16730 [Curtobacterium sp. MCBA15_001]